MRGLAYHKKPRNLTNQKALMKRLWPEFDFSILPHGYVCWIGKVRGFQQFYRIAVIWSPSENGAPYVRLLEPKLTPREGGSFEDIPHLWYDIESPERSGLCLFDPAQNQWDNKMAIAETTILWAAQWLYYYECWHLTGEWQGGGVGYESMAQMKDANVR